MPESMMRYQGLASVVEQSTSRQTCAQVRLIRFQPGCRASSKRGFFSGEAPVRKIKIRDACTFIVVPCAEPGSGIDLLCGIPSRPEAIATAHSTCHYTCSAEAYADDVGNLLLSCEILHGSGHFVFHKIIQRVWRRIVAPASPFAWNAPC
jgi:hypothetical protein